MSKYKIVSDSSEIFLHIYKGKNKKLYFKYLIISIFRKTKKWIVNNLNINKIPENLQLMILAIISGILVEIIKILIFK